MDRLHNKMKGIKGYTINFLDHNFLAKAIQKGSISGAVRVDETQLVGYKHIVDTMLKFISDTRISSETAYEVFMHFDFDHEDVQRTIDYLVFSKDDLKPCYIPDHCNLTEEEVIKMKKAKQEQIDRLKFLLKAWKGDKD